MQINIRIDGLKKIQHKLKISAEKLHGSRQFWQSVGMFVQRQTTRERFSKEQSPDGIKWKPLSPATVKHRRKRHKKGIMKILQDTRELLKSISYEAGNNFVKIGSKLKYSRTHQFGRGKIPARPFLGVNDGEKSHITSMFRTYIKRNVLGGG